MPSVSTIIVRTSEPGVIVSRPGADPRVAVVEVSPPRGLPGAEIELRVNDTHVQWRVVGAAAWTNLIALSAITGPAGATGATGAAGAAGATGSPGSNGLSPELQVSGTLLQWRYSGSGGSWTTIFDLDTLAGDAALTETVPAVAQVSTITINTNAASDLDGDYIDLPITGATVRAWFNVDNAGSAPASPAPGRLIEVNISSSGNSGDFSSALAAALAADPDLSASSSGNTTTAEQPAGALSVPSSTDTLNVTISVTTPGADAYPRFLPIDGTQVTGVNAALLDGTPASGFAPLSHTHDYIAGLTNRPICKTLANDHVASSSTLASVTGVGVAVVGGRTYHFDFHGFYSTSTSVEDAGFAMNGPASSGIVVQSEIVTASTGTTAFARATAWDTTHQTNAATARSNLPFRISGKFTATADGILYPRLKTESASGQSSTIHAGAALHVIPVD